MSVHLFGIRHHGPGSARSLLNALRKLEPDCLLIEGPPEANRLIPLVLDEAMMPPVSLLLYAKDEPSQAVFYPFAIYSPEWQALRYGSSEQIETRFFDLPVAVRFAQEDKNSLPEDAFKLDKAEMEYQPSLQQDPLFYLAQAAGYSDGERWWGHVVEERQAHEDVFEAILEAMTALREESSEPLGREALREASMREAMRKAQKEGFERIAVVCGAWHAPALKDLKNAKADKALLKGLKKTKLEATWIPYTSARLARESGYGAGIQSPGWYEHIWHYAGQNDLAARWLARVAQLLRAEDLEASSAQVIEAVRLAEALAAMRGRASVGLDELNEAAYALFANGNDLILQLIRDKLVIADVLGAVSKGVPLTPLQLDLIASQKNLWLKASADEKNIELDLRKDTDLKRSQLLHRLRLLGIPWGETRHSNSKGTFKEAWQLRWQPEFELRLIESGRFGQTIEQATLNKLKELALGATNIADLSALLDDTLLADLPKASQFLVDSIQLKAAEDTDLTHLMTAFPRLAHVLRYGNVRTSAEQNLKSLEKVSQGILARICVGLANASSSLSDDAARELFGLLQKLHSAVKLLQDADTLSMWLSTLKQVSVLNNAHALIKGRSSKILLDEAELETNEAAKRLSLALSDPNVEQAASWLEGFLKEGGLLLLHDDELFKVIDSWFASLSEESFIRVLPLVRRTFSSFATPERQAIGQKAKTGTVQSQKQKLNLNHERGQRVLSHISGLIATQQSKEQL